MEIKISLMGFFGGREVDLKGQLKFEQLDCKSNHKFFPIQHPQLRQFYPTLTLDLVM